MGEKMIKKKSFTKNFGLILSGSGNSQNLFKLEQKEVLALLAKHGMILFDKMASGHEDFQAFTEKFTNQFIVHGSPIRKKISDDGRTKTVNEGYADIALHAELQNTPFIPDVLWFFCDQPATKGGQTTVADGVEFLRKLSPSSRKALIGKKIRYKMVWSPDYWETYFAGIDKEHILSELQKLGGIEGHFDSNNELTYFYDSSPVNVTYGGELALTSSILTHAQYEIDKSRFQAKDQVTRHDFFYPNGKRLPKALIEELFEVAEKVTHELEWKANQFVMIDNYRLLHGRRSFEPGDIRKVYLRLCNLPKNIIHEHMRSAA
jgi:alpha-ketoglutarate-dependent taurine dioxygenase